MLILVRFFLGFIFIFSGGAGGKGTWGAYGSELSGEASLDYKDPNYDSESLENGDIQNGSSIGLRNDQFLGRF